MNQTREHRFGMRSKLMLAITSLLSECDSEVTMLRTTLRRDAQ